MPNNPVTKEEIVELLEQTAQEIETDTYDDIQMMLYRIRDYGIIDNISSATTSMQQGMPDE